MPVQVPAGGYSHTVVALDPFNQPDCNKRMTYLAIQGWNLVATHYDAEQLRTPLITIWEWVGRKEARHNSETSGEWPHF